MPRSPTRRVSRPQAIPPGSVEGASTDQLLVRQSDGEWRPATAGTDSLADDAVTNAKLRNSGALSVIGRSANSSGDPADIVATAASAAVLRESGSTVGFGTVVTAGLADGAVTEVKQTLADNTTGNVSATAHGYAPKFPNNTTTFLRGDGAYSSLPVKTIRKSASETVNNSTTLQNDDHLLGSVAASEVWTFMFVLFVSGVQASDIRIDVIGPSGSTVTFGVIGLTTGSTNVSNSSMNTIGNLLGGTNIGSVGTDSATGHTTVLVMGSCVNSTTAGDLQLRWAQNTADVSDLIVRSQSFLTMWRV